MCVDLARLWIVVELPHRSDTSLSTMAPKQSTTAPKQKTNKRVVSKKLGKKCYFLSQGGDLIDQRSIRYSL